MRTDEQVAADDALTEAILRVDAAYHGEDPTRVLGDYMVIASFIGWDDDGHSNSAYSFLFRDNDSAPHRSLGLVEYARNRMAQYE